jgi:hypothetical protein
VLARKATGRVDGFVVEKPAVGIQVGTLFAYCQESGLADDYKRSGLARAARGEVDHLSASPWIDEPGSATCASTNSKSWQVCHTLNGMSQGRCVSPA